MPLFLVSLIMVNGVIMVIMRLYSEIEDDDVVKIQTLNFKPLHVLFCTVFWQFVHLSLIDDSICVFSEGKTNRSDLQIRK